MGSDASTPSPGFDGERCARTLVPCGVGFILVGAALGWPVGLAAGACGLLLLALATHSRQDGFVLLGPAVRWELTRSARRGRMFVWRAFVVVIALALVGYPFQVLTDQSMADMLDLRPSTIPPYRAATATSQLFWTLYLFVGVAAILAALAVLPPVVAEERESGRLDHMLVTDLRNREIVVGKLIGRFGVIAAVLAALAPLPALFPLLGGMDGRVVAAAAAMIAFTIIGVAGVGLLFSGTARRSWDATRDAAAVVAAYLFVSVVVLVVLKGPTGGIGTTTKLVGIGNPLVGAVGMTQAVAAADVDNALDWVICGYVPFHLALFGAGLFRAVRTLRTNTPTEVKRERARTRRMAKAAANRPPVSDQPILWYEVHGRPIWRLVGATSIWWSVGGIAAVSALALIAFIAVLILHNFLYALFGYSLLDDFDHLSPLDAIRRIGRSLAPFFQLAGLWAVLGVTLPAAFAAARTVTREKELDTYEALILTGIRPGTMIRQKWLGAILRQRVRFLLLASFGFLGAAFGLIHAVGYAALLVTTFLNTILAAAAGTILGVYSRTMWQATYRLGAAALAWTVFVFVVTWYLASVRGLSEIERTVAVAAIPPMPQIVSAANWGLDEVDVRGRVDESTTRAFGLAAGSVTGLAALAMWPVWGWARRKYTRDLDPCAERMRRRREPS